ncbi:MAG TPA: hypothetical protein VMV17_25205 [Streptosporangiaceae bacterium]|nr:hypothetical protein [Streptosporangiaceae bacterium]
MAAGEQVRRVPDSELDFDNELIYRWRGQLFTGIGYDDTSEAGLSEISYRDGLQDGPGRDWFPSGGLKAESWYLENTLHGFSREFNEDQVMVSEEIYEYGILVRRTRWDDAGSEVESWNIDPGGPGFARLQRYRAEKRWPAVA